MTFRGILKPTRRAILAMPALLAAPRGFAAETYPNKSVRVIMSYGAGSGTDLFGREIAKQLTQQTGQSFVIENHTGAGGIVGNEILVRSPPDGYTLIVMDTGVAITANMYKSLPYNAMTDFTCISQFARTPEALVVNPSLNIHTLQELIAYARANPGKLNYGSSGVGGSLQLFFELFKIQAKVDIKHIPYDGGSTMMAAALRNDVQVLMTAVGTTKPYVQSGQLRPLAVTSDGKRVASMPDVPTMAEAGVPGMVIYSFQGIGGPRGLPKDIVTDVYHEVVKALAVPDVKGWFTAQDAETVGSTPEEFTAFFHSEVRRWGDVIKQAGIPVNP